MLKTTLSLLIASTLVSASVEKPDVRLKQGRLDTALAELAPVTEEKEVVEIETVNYFTCDECTIQEQMALEAFQDRGITDKLALAALMGNIKHESRFVPDICEGGARVPYHHCHRGGFGLIQWTTTGRYDGLGRHARNNECNPSTTECQLGYLFTEREWNKVERYMKTPGKTIEWYMKHAYTWLGWGIHGARTDYAYNYARMLYKA